MDSKCPTPSDTVTIMNNEDITTLAEITIEETPETIDSRHWAAMVIDAASGDIDEDWI